VPDRELSRPQSMNRKSNSLSTVPPTTPPHQTFTFIHKIVRTASWASARYKNTGNLFIQVAQLSQRDRAAGWVSYGQKWKTGTGRQYFTDIIGLSSITDVNGQQCYRIR